MRKILFLISVILLTFSLSVFAQTILSSSINSSTDSIDNKDIYKLITTGQENEIRKYFKEVTFNELIRSDTGTIVKAFNRLNTKDKVTHTIWILEEVKNRPANVREHVYTELEKVEYNKPSFFLKQLINNYFTNFNEKEVTLIEKISALQKKMNK